MTAAPIMVIFRMRRAGDRAEHEQGGKGEACRDRRRQTMFRDS
jgi:hypothetical protein